jgi:hypothetical protein
MRNLAFHRAPAMLSCGLALTLCAAAVTAAPAGARTTHRTAHTSQHRGAHTSLGRAAHTSLAERAPVRLSVVGNELVWSPISGVTSYLERQRLGHKHLHRVLTATTLGLQPLHGGTASYSVRTDVKGSTWSSITVVYGSSGAIAKVYGEGAGRGGSGSGSGSGESGSGESGSGESGSGSGSSGSGSGGGSGSESGSGGSGSGAGGSGSESESGSGTGGSGSETESESGSAGGGKEGHGSGGLKVGLIGGIYGWGQSVGETIRKATGVRYTKLTVGPEGWGTVEEMVHDGVTPLILYNPGMAGMSPAAVAAGVKTYVSHMQQLGLTEMELGNEVYYNGSTAWEYAAQYKAAHEALAGSGITLIADAWTDTPKPNGEWSQWESGGGWCVLFVQALGYVPDAWSFHPYGPMTADGFGSSGVWRTGWDTVPRMISYMKADHIYAPLDITEVGQVTWQGTDGNTPVTEAEQAQDVKQYIRQAAEWGLTGIYLYEAIDTGEGGYGLYKWPLQAKPSAGAFAETLQELGAKPGVLAGGSQFASLPSSSGSALVG